ncbi:hypothetical protein FRB90_008145, partial [Tulasnella sp. 427]
MHWAEPLELPENRILAWFRYQRKSTSSQSPAPRPKHEDTEETNTPRTLVKHELSPEASVRRSVSRVSGMEDMDLSDDDERQVELQVSQPEATLSPSVSAGRHPSPPTRTATLPDFHQLPTPTPSASSSPNPSNGDQ